MGGFSTLVAEHALLTGISFHQRNVTGVASAQAQVAERLAVDGEDAAGRPVLRRHVGDGGAVRQRHVVQAVTVELDEFSYHAPLAELFDDSQDQIRRRRPFRQLARELEADDVGYQHGNRLAEHGRFRLDTAHAPAENAEAVDHCRMGVGADDGVGEGARRAVVLLGEYHTGQVFQIDLMHDAGIRRYDFEVGERVLAPAQEGIALLVAGELQLCVQIHGVRLGECVHLQRVVDDQLHRRHGTDLFRVVAEGAHCVAHGGEIHDRRHAGEVLQQHPCRRKGDLRGRLGFRVPSGQGLDVAPGNVDAVLMAKQVLEENLERVG